MSTDDAPDDPALADDETDADAAHAADRPPTSEEAAAAERALHDPELAGDQQQVGEHYRDMTERGVDDQGEGRID